MIQRNCIASFPCSFSCFSYTITKKTKVQEKLQRQRTQHFYSRFAKQRPLNLRYSNLGQNIHTKNYKYKMFTIITDMGGKCLGSCNNEYARYHVEGKFNYVLTPPRNEWC